MLNYFNKTSPAKWTISDALEEASKVYPEKLRAYHLHLVKEDLRTLSLDNSKETRQKRAIDLINNWDPPKESSRPKLASTIVNKANVQTNYQATYQTITQAHEPQAGVEYSDDFELSPIPPTTYSQSTRKRPYAQSLTDDEQETEELVESGGVFEMCEETVGIWHLWMELLTSMSTYEDVHQHSLERLNIIQMGNKISSATTRKYYPEQLIDRTNILVKNITDYYVDGIEYHNTFFDRLMTSIEDAKTFLKSESLKIHQNPNKFDKFAEQVYRAFTNEVLGEEGDVYVDEINLNYRLIFPIVQALSEQIVDLQFLPGETRLKAVAKELYLLLNDTSHYYNADATLSLRSLDIEVALLETTGKLRVEDKPKETKDYVKATYGLLSMLHTIGRKFEYADFSLFKKVNIYFLQVTPCKIRVWKFSIMDDKLYCINCIGSAHIPIQREDCEIDIRKLVNLLWLLKDEMEQTKAAIEKLKLSHMQNCREIARKRPGHENLKSLTVFFRENVHIIFPEKTVKNADSIYMNSF